MKGSITLMCIFYRTISVVDRRWNRIPEILEYDSSNNIPSTFFFGMANGLGMSYDLKKANLWIQKVRERNFDVGVHGIDFINPQMEYELFKKYSGLGCFGIRMHYVRYNAETFTKLAKCRYLFDCSEFDKQQICLKDPYRIDALWEFPLQIMDGYILKNGFEKAKYLTIQSLHNAESRGMSYFSFLFHDYYYNEKTYPVYKEYYEWFIDLCKSRNYDFASYISVVKELDKKGL
jgi:hypothetical protein